MLSLKHYEVFLPMYTTRRRWSDRFKSIELPLFPGYVFCRFQLEERLPVLTTPGVLHIVGAGQHPVPVDEREIVSLQLVVKSNLQKPWPFLKAGERLTIAEGPLRGLEGILVTLRGAHKLIVSVTLLQRSVALEIDRDWVRPLSSAR